MQQKVMFISYKRGAGNAVCALSIRIREVIS